MLKVHSLSFDYFDQPLLRQVNFSLPKGTLLHLQGKNGAGKTTLLKLLAGIFYPLSGNIEWEGADIQDDLPRYQRNLCYVGHKPGLNRLLTVRENCFFDAHWGRKESEFFELLRHLGMEGWLDKPCYQLSQGQQRRVALLRTAITDAPLWLLDEPLAALDKASIAGLMENFKTHLARGGMIIISSHQPLSQAFHHYPTYAL